MGLAAACPVCIGVRSVDCTDRGTVRERSVRPRCSDYPGLSPHLRRAAALCAVVTVSMGVCELIPQAKMARRFRLFVLSCSWLWRDVRYVQRLWIIDRPRQQHGSSLALCRRGARCAATEGRRGNPQTYSMTNDCSRRLADLRSFAGAKFRLRSASGPFCQWRSAAIMPATDRTRAKLGS